MTSLVAMTTFIFSPLIGTVGGQFTIQCVVFCIPMQLSVQRIDHQTSAVSVVHLGHWSLYHMRGLLCVELTRDYNVLAIATVMLSNFALNDNTYNKMAHRI